MRIVMPPKTAHFKSGILFFNITQKRYTIVDEDIVANTDICFIFSEHSIYASLGISEEFYVRVHETGDVYGPYPDPTSIVTLHLFGRYDNLVGFLRKSFVQNSETNSIEFSFNGFRYGKFTYDFDGNLSQIARDIYLQIPPIEDPFEYEFGTTTFFADGAIEFFVNKLNVLFNSSNFNEEFDDAGKYMIASVDRASGLGARMNSGRSIIFMNASNRRHAVFFVPIDVPVGYVNFEGDGTQESEDILAALIDTAPIRTVTNSSQIELLAERYGITQDVASVDIITLDFFKNIIFAAVFGDSVQKTYLFVEDDTLGVIAFEMDMFTKKIRAMSHDNIELIADSYDNVSLSISSGSLKVSFKDDIVQCAGSEVLSMSINGFSFCGDMQNNRAYASDGNVMSINYVGNMLNKAFV